MSNREGTPLDLHAFNAMRRAGATNVPDKDLMVMAMRLVDDVVDRTQRTQDDRRVTLERDDKNGYVNVMQHGAILSRTKSINVARRIRDALNAPDSLVGQTIEGSVPYAGVVGGPLRDVRGVVLVLVPGATVGVVLRKADGTLDSFPIPFLEGAMRIVEPDAPEPVTWEP